LAALYKRRLPLTPTLSAEGRGSKS
jgi:hypothetical protein